MQEERGGGQKKYCKGVEIITPHPFDNNCNDTKGCRHAMHEQGQCDVDTGSDKFRTYMRNAEECEDGE